MNAKLFLPCAALLAATLISPLQAQVALKAGVNIASISANSQIENVDELEQTSVVGFQAGISFDLGLSEVFTLQPEILYIQKGGKFESRANDNNFYEGRLYYNFIEVPVLAKLKFLSESGSGFYFLGGPFVGFALDGKVKQNGQVLGVAFDDTDKFEFDDQDNERRLDWGVSFGGGVKFNSVFLDLRYNLGINNLLDNDADNTNDDKPYRRTRGIGLTLGYEF